MRLQGLLWTCGLGLAAGLLAHALLALPLAAALGCGLAAPMLLRVLLARADRHEVVAVRADVDFGRIALLDDGRWEGAVSLAGLARPVDIEIEAAGEGPTLAQRLAYEDACAQLQDLLPELARETGLAAAEFHAAVRFLRLRLPAEQERAPDWALSYTLGDECAAQCWEVAVRRGRIMNVERAA